MATKSLPFTADYLIIGGGTAGLVVACRLSEDPALNIVVLESGPDRSNDPQVQNPDAWHSLSGSDLDWKFEIVPQVGSLNKHLKGETDNLLCRLASTIAVKLTRLERSWVDLPQSMDWPMLHPPRPVSMPGQSSETRSGLGNLSDRISRRASLRHPQMVCLNRISKAISRQARPTSK
jgi:hypothetical protein